jgi:hypothetical protein
MLTVIYEQLPPRIRAGIKRMLASSGHRSSILDVLKAKRQARGSKHFSIALEQLVAELEFAEINSLKDKRCLEFGAGYIPTELAYYWLQGACQLIAVDYNRIGRFHYLPIALAGADPKYPGIEKFSCDRIQYVAPFDAGTDRLPNDVDFIHSTAVLEHIAPNEVPTVLANLGNALASDGVMIHSIDLKDHLDPKNNPNAFLDDDTYNVDTDYDVRGNRLRKSDWLRMFSCLRGFHITWRTGTLPCTRVISGYADDDLLTSEITVVCKKIC